MSDNTVEAFWGAPYHQETLNEQVYQMDVSRMYSTAHGYSMLHVMGFCSENIMKLQKKLDEANEDFAAMTEPQQRQPNAMGSSPKKQIEQLRRKIRTAGVEGNKSHISLLWEAHDQCAAKANTITGPAPDTLFRVRDVCWFRSADRRLEAGDLGFCYEVIMRSANVLRDLDWMNHCYEMGDGLV